MQQSTKFVKLWQIKMDILNNMINVFEQIGIGIYDEADHSYRLKKIEYSLRFDKVILTFIEGDIDEPLVNENLKFMYSAMIDDFNKTILDLYLVGIGIYDQEDFDFRVDYITHSPAYDKLIVRFKPDDIKEDFYDADSLEEIE